MSEAMEIWMAGKTPRQHATFLLEEAEGDAISAICRLVGRIESLHDREERMEKRQSELIFQLVKAEQRVSELEEVIAEMKETIEEMEEKC